MTAIAEETGADPVDVRAFLDSAWGRHFADTVRDFLGQYDLTQAVAAAITHWNSWKLSARTRRELDIPMPYLSGMIYAVGCNIEIL